MGVYPGCEVCMRGVRGVCKKGEGCERGMRGVREGCVKGVCEV